MKKQKPQTNIQHLLSLLEHSRSISSNDKKRFATAIPLMTNEELQQFEQILIEEKARAAQIDDEYQNSSHALREEYDHTVLDFKTHKIPKLRKTVEAKTRKEESKKADDMLNAL